MKCKLCDNNINSISLYELIFNRDVLCKDCRSKMNFRKRIIKTNNYSITYFYDYNQMFQTLLLQYKECYDEALYDAFLFKIDTYISIKYWNYSLLLAPSSKEKTDKRGFNHLEKIFSGLSLKRVNGLYLKDEMNQKGKTYIQRQKMENNFIYKGPKLDKVLIIDDVYTTGSTIKGLYSAIKPYANRIEVLVLAKTGRLLNDC